MAEVQSLHRLLQEQDAGIKKTEDEIAALIAYKADYEVLMTKLENFPKAVSRPAILPFGRKALVPGRLIHTNELLVHLGGSDELFVELSVYETIELIKRRVERLDASIEKLKDQRRLIQDRVQYTSQFAHQAPHVVTQPPKTENEINTVNACEEVEIRESYDSDTERQWKSKHLTARKKERDALNAMPDPVLKRRVRFARSAKKDALRGVEAQSESDRSTASSTTSSDSDSSPPSESFIYFHHSATPSVIPREDISDLSTMTVAEAVNRMVSRGTLLSPDPVQPKLASAFGDIVERNVDEQHTDPACSHSVKPSVSQPTRISKFRSDRQQRK
ncbi:Unconventional prefoldin RPB5 interactor [Fasciolopsis buskii]|uniref:Unconventional prefoldin RPB5 interactor n=1 Tax=Fasciolopsis buskii TaxID=27845 RepID=A0A8E0VNJ6_9TREM|nr:Unconventional prefoldin RPB5 interactor [Fasciolopsis buski]